VHVVPAVHRVPHAPQLELSVCSSTQAAPHAASPPVQAQTPALHV
jgi:hypothetical protein